MDPMMDRALRFRWHYLWLALLAAGLLALVNGCTTYARDRLYAPSDRALEMPEWAVPAPENVTVTTEDGLTLPGFYWAPAEGEQDVILVLHGRRDNYARMGGYVQRLHQDGRGVLVASYRGFNGNPGSPSQEGLILDAQAFFRLARERVGADGDVYVFGHSLGGGVAFQLAAREELAGVITLATFTDIEDVAPFYADPFIPDPWPSLATLPQVAEPLLLIHGADDDYVRPRNARELYAATCSEASLTIIGGVRHKPNFRLIQPIMTQWIAATEAGTTGEMRLEGGASWEHKAACATR